MLGVWVHGLGGAAEDQIRALENAAAKGMPPCQVDCERMWEGVRGAAHLPPGTVQLPYGFYWHLVDFQGKDLNKPFERAYEDDKLTPGQWQILNKRWREVSAGRLKQTLDNDERASTLPRPVGGGAGPLRSASASTQGGRNRPLKEFLAKFPDYIVSWRDIAAPAPTTAEMNDRGGTGKYLARGGYLLSRKVMNGEVSLTTTTPSACVQWCRSDCHKQYYPLGRPYCAQEIYLETQGYDWGVAAQRGNGYVLIIYRRLPKTTWEKMVAPLESLAKKIDSATDSVCTFMASPAGQASAAAVMATGDPATKLSAAWTSMIVTEGCRSRLKQPVVVTPTTPPPPPPTAPAPPPVATPWHQTGAGTAVLTVAGGLALGSLVFVGLRLAR